MKGGVVLVIVLLSLICSNGVNGVNLLRNLQKETKTLSPSTSQEKGTLTSTTTTTTSVPPKGLSVEHSNVAVTPKPKAALSTSNTTTSSNTTTTKVMQTPQQMGQSSPSTTTSTTTTTSVPPKTSTGQSLPSTTTSTTGAVPQRPKGLSAVNTKTTSDILTIPNGSIKQLTVSTDLTTLTNEIAAGYVSKSTSVMIAWQAAQSSTEVVKEIHSLAGGEEGVTTGRTWVYNVSGWAGLDDWMTTYATELALYGTYSSSANTISWVIGSPADDQPSNATCTAFATAIGEGDLATALVIASFTQTEDLYMTSSAYEAQVALQSGASGLLAERYDSSCLGYKYFSYYDSTTQWATSAITSPTWTD